MTRVRILRYLVTVPDASAADVATALRISPPTAGMVLLRLARNGLVIRTSDPGRDRLFYALTRRGEARLRFLERRGS